MEPPPASDTERSDLVRGLGLWSATAIVIGDTIGTGVFLVTSDMARAVGSATLVLVELSVALSCCVVLSAMPNWAQLSPKQAALTSTLTADSDHSGDFFLAG